MPHRLLPMLLLCLAPAGLRAEDRFFDSNGVRIRYTVVGRGEPVLLIHGFAASIETQWVLPGILQELSRDHRVIAFDNRGHGRSGKPHQAGRYGPEMAEDAVRLLDHLGVKRAHVVGYSMGAAITGKLLATHPDRLLSATLGGAGAVLEDSDTRPLEALADSLERGKGFGPLLAALTPPGRPRPTEEQVRAVDRVLSSANDVQALAAVARGMKGLAITRAQARAVRVPTEAVVGDQDPLKKGVDELKTVLPGLRVVVIRGAGHVTAFARPEFVRAVKGFLSQNRRKTEPAGAGR